MELQVLHYSSLSRDQLFNLVHLRIQVFVVEQNCPYQELDNFDRDSFHIFGTINDDLICVGRIIPFNHLNKVSIGRIAVHKNHRKNKFAFKMMCEINKFISDKFSTFDVELSAQTYLQDFYQSFGFSIEGEEYLEDGIPHILMKKIN